MLDKEDKPVKVCDVAKNPECEWEIVILGEGAKGPIFAQVCSMRVVEHRDDLPGKNLMEK